MKQGWAFAWRSLMAAEIYVTILTGFGLGQLLHYGRELNSMDQVIGIMIVIVVIGLLVDKILFAPIGAIPSPPMGNEPVSVMKKANEDAVTVSREIKILNPLGLHARPAAEFAKRANAFRSEIWIVKEGKRFSAASLIDILRANLDQGSVATLEATGRDAEAAVERLVQLLHEFKD